MLDTTRWERVCALVEDALHLPPSQSAGALAEMEPDAEVCREAMSLLAAHRRAGERFLTGDVVSHGLIDNLATAWVGRLIGPYRVLEEIGKGGMGVVLLAARADDLYERRVAIKVVRADLQGELFLRRFRKEIRILAAFDHPAIARLLDAGITEDGSPYLVMEYIDGTRIDHFCRQRESSAVEILQITAQIAEAVSYAHRLRVVHRDLKPGNILVTAAGQPKLLDFGIAQMAGDGLDDSSAMTEPPAWTPAYASPEQLAGQAVTTRSDVFSLGVLLYCLLTGKHPYRSSGIGTVLMQEAFETVSPLPPSRLRRSRRELSYLMSVDPVVLKALQVRPESRYATATELAQDLRRAIAGEGTMAHMPSLLERAMRWLRRRRGWIAIAGFLAFCSRLMTCNTLTR